MASQSLSQKPGLSQGYCVLFTTAGSMDEARRIARILLKKRAAACVNLLPNVGSWYWWKGKVEQGKEVLLLIKTSRSRLKILSHLLKKSHSYELPELIALPIVWGDRGYLSWLGRNLVTPRTPSK